MPTIKVENSSGRLINPFSGHSARATVFIFVSAECPISNSYAPEYNRLQADYGSKGVALSLVYPNSDEGLEVMREHARQFNLHPEQFWDPNHALVKAAGVTITPEAAIFVPGHGFVYRGRIDNRFAKLGVARAQATASDLRQALNALLEGKPVPTQQQTGVGCLISAP